MVRRMLTQVLSKEPSIEVVGHAIDGQFALQKIKELKPDILTLDIEMPGQNGLETLDQLRGLRMKIPVIMFSTLTDRGASATLDALAKGANDYVCKPSNKGNVDEVIRSIHQDLVPKIKAAVGRQHGVRVPGLIAPRPTGVLGRGPRLTRPKVTAGGGSSGPGAGAASSAPASGGTTKLENAQRTKPAASKLDLLAIGISTGGPNALNDLLPRLPANFPVPIVITQHMPPVFTRLLAERLDAKCQLQVAEAKGGEHPRPGEVWIAPGDHHMVLENQKGGFQLALNQDAPENSCRPAVDPMFRSAARIFGNRMLALVMTGMGSDGTEGCRSVLQAGGEIWAQDEESSVVWGMPGFVTNEGLVDRVVALGDLGAELVGRFPIRGHARPKVGKV